VKYEVQNVEIVKMWKILLCK